MRRLDEVHQFMEHNVLQAFHGLLGQLGVETDGATLVIAPQESQNRTFLALLVSGRRYGMLFKVHFCTFKKSQKLNGRPVWGLASAWHADAS